MERVPSYEERRDVRKEEVSARRRASGQEDEDGNPINQDRRSDSQRRTEALNNGAAVGGN